MDEEKLGHRIKAKHDRPSRQRLAMWSFSTQAGRMACSLAYDLAM
jgi:hypothetical protein